MIGALQEARILAVIPARYAAHRLPGKPLADLGGKPVIQHVYERASRASLVDAVVVATDDPRIAEAVRGFDGRVMMTARTHRSGSERAAEVARRLPAVQVVLNIQGDEPFVEAAAIDALAAPLCAPGGPEFTTLREALAPEGDRENPHVVKVVTDRDGYALYFSRAPIPHCNGRLPAEVYRHVGLYGFRRDALLWFASQQASPLEGAEGLEQLRILEHGRRIAVLESGFQTMSIDTPEDLERARLRLAGEEQQLRRIGVGA